MKKEDNDWRRSSFKKPRKGKWIILGFTILLGFVSLWLIYSFAQQIRKSEQAKVRLWANAINQKAQLMSSTETFFNEVDLDERRKVQLYIDVLESFNNSDLTTDADFCLSYVSYIVDSSRTPFMIIDEDSLITSCGNIADSPEKDREMIGTKVSPEMLGKFSNNPPFHYDIWGIPLTLIYKESQIYSDMRAVLDNLNVSFLSEVTNNSVFVPVIIVDSLKQNVISYGNVNHKEFDTPEKLKEKLNNMASENDPIELRMANHSLAYVFYESTPLLRLLRFLPLIYLFLGMILVLVSYNLFRTARSNEENRVWVGMAKETAHQLGTPISSLIAWADYLDGKTFEEPYSSEVRKDINRLETIARRFSKIGSVPELKDEDVCEVIRHTLSYMEKRSPKKVVFVQNLPDKPLIAPMNRYLFEWVIENICKNAIDAMEGVGTFTTIVALEGKNICIDLCDTGKGIAQNKQKYIFESGFSTKPRGWGLGLSLAKRIIKEYHKGKIFLKYSIPNQGTVFRIVLKQAES